jgi:hypothetical protein
VVAVVLAAAAVAAVAVAPAAAVAVGAGSAPIGWDVHVTPPIVFGACRPAYLETNSATAAASLPTTTFCGMIAPENPPFSIAYRTRVIGRSHRTLKFGPSVIWRVRTFAADP